MAKAPIPSKPWTGLDCRPEDLVLLAGSVLRGEFEEVARWAKTSKDAVQVVEMLASRHRAGPFLAFRLKGSAAWEALPEAASDAPARDAPAHAALKRCRAEVPQTDLRVD